MIYISSDAAMLLQVLYLQETVLSHQLRLQELLLSLQTIREEPDAILALQQA